MFISKSNKFLCNHKNSKIHAGFCQPTEIFFSIVGLSFGVYSKVVILNLSDWIVDISYKYVIYK